MEEDVDQFDDVECSEEPVAAPGGAELPFEQSIGRNMMVLRSLEDAAIQYQEMMGVLIDEDHGPYAAVVASDWVRLVSALEVRFATLIPEAANMKVSANMSRFLV
ncbi:hypothetical protein KXW98_003218 [Aspergillus fumigatus]|uniref:Uncharacterized protein n=1 Tax=Aspergillus fumigatus TaxID=746128 RepID=A0A229WN55_ASPFM|nr:hypothetical protein CNMCM8714_001386 [Aspergillus fumigatus]KAF4272533.1 hypothetical protein CNMCM8057_006152 [Aspergillus fumigatus]KAF4273292.1 hypothetical protein CNMCM8812_007771 [Aspergillus fumigatus]KAF4282736.1 hypothetical protein CNMCM8689_007910 [Aspergillus fumigatus]KAF4293293.1 hypothetical protein CNMCM8686_006316 [Aspergillus fumigatus]